MLRHPTMRNSKTKNNSVSTAACDLNRETAAAEVAGTECKSDLLNICLLLILYMLQGLPKALSRSIPLLLQNRKVDYSDQAIYSLTTLPFGVKLLWAPIVDCIYSPRLGQRKSWLIPSQFALGFCLLIVWMFGDVWLGPEGESNKHNIVFLTIIFVIINMLAATQDIAVDGWALTLLQRKNIGHAGTCDYVGRHIGELLGYVLFTVLSSKKFCDTWLRSSPQPTGIISLSGFALFWSFVYLIMTFLIWIFKRERRPEIVVASEDIRMNVCKSYMLLWRILKIKPLRTLCLIALTSKIGFAVVEVVTPLKLMSFGVSSHNIVLIGIPLLPLQAILPFVLKRYLIGTRSMDCYAHAIIYRCFIAGSMGTFMYYSLSMKEGGHFPVYYYFLMYLLLGLEDMGTYAMAVSFQSYAARISDANFGGTYITLLNTAHILGNKFPEVIALGLKDWLTWTSCAVRVTQNRNSTLMEKAPKLETRYSCTDVLDGYYIEIIFGIVFTIVWLIFWAKKTIRNLQRLKESAWLVTTARNKEIENTLL